MSNTWKTIEKLPKQEMLRRHDLCRKFCQNLNPELSGLMVFSPLNIYYLTGTLADGFLWLPMEGEPVLFVKRALERCFAESHLTNILLFKSYVDSINICNDLGLDFGKHMALEMGALPWDMVNDLQLSFAKQNFVNGDMILAKARSRKSEWELNKMRIAGERHNAGLYELLPERLKAGMSERDVARLSWDIFFSLGHGGINRLGNFGEECFLGHIAAGDNGNYPSHFNGPLGLMGEHPATPCMGNAKSIWENEQVLALDIGFIFEGYHTDKTQVYFAGNMLDIPDDVRRAHDACIFIQDRASQALKAGAIPAEIWESAEKQAQKLGVSEGFMGLGKNKVPFLGHGIGLVIDEYPVLASRFEEPLELGMTIAIEPKVGIPNVGMVGVENTFVVGEHGGQSLTGLDFSIICVE